jgi:hypothetical protein
MTSRWRSEGLGKETKRIHDGYNWPLENKIHKFASTPRYLKVDPHNSLKHPWAGNPRTLRSLIDSDPIIHVFYVVLTDSVSDFMGGCLCTMLMKSEYLEFLITSSLEL